MNSTKKVVGLSVLCFFALGVIELITKGAFIVPFPLIPFFVVIIAFVMAIKKDVKRFDKITVAIYAVLSLLSSQVVWSIFLNDHQMMALTNGIYLDLLYLGSMLTFLLVIIQLQWSKVKIRNIVFILSGGTIFCLGILLNEDTYIRLAFVFIAALTGLSMAIQKQSISDNSTHYLLIGIGLFEFMSLTTKLLA